MTASPKMPIFLPQRKTPAKPKISSPAAELLERAWEVRRHAVADYSGFLVGAALRSKEGSIHTGCNIENATYGLTVCAERVAVLKALSEGVRRFTEIAVVTASPKLTPPCGACRQILWEFCGNITLHLANEAGQYRRLKLAALFPSPFDNTHFKK
jgi:cytidine deaminase